MDPEKKHLDNLRQTDRVTTPDDRGLIGQRDFDSWQAIDQSIGKSEFWKSRCFDKEPMLMQHAEGVHYGAIHRMGLKLKGLFHHQPWFAVVVHKELTLAFLMGMYFGERRFHSSPDNLMPTIEYPDPSAGISQMDEPPPDKDEIVTDFEETDFE